MVDCVRLTEINDGRRTPDCRPANLPEPQLVDRLHIW